MSEWMMTIGGCGEPHRESIEHNVEGCECVCHGDRPAEPPRHDPNCCSHRGCHPNICSHGTVQPDGSLKCGTWRSLPPDRPAEPTVQEEAK